MTEFISELKQIKQQNTRSDLQVLLSDVKEAPAAFNLIKDSHQELPKTEGKPSEQEMDEALQKALMVRMFLNPTVRLIKFGMMYNSRTDLIMKLNDIGHNP